MDYLALRGGVYCTTSGLLTATGAVTTYDTTVTIVYASDGKLKTKTAITTGVTPTLDANTGLAFPALVGGASVANTPGQGAIVVWMLNWADGVVKCAMGPIKALDMQGNFANGQAPDFPSIPAGMVPFAYQVLKAGATASATAIVFGTANWNATGFTNVIQNVAVLPSRIQVA
jgi:hypothetical protein